MNYELLSHFDARAVIRIENAAIIRRHAVRRNPHDAITATTQRDKTFQSSHIGAEERYPARILQDGVPHIFAHHVFFNTAIVRLPHLGGVRTWKQADARDLRNLALFIFKFHEMIGMDMTAEDDGVVFAEHVQKTHPLRVRLRAAERNPAVRVGRDDRQMADNERVTGVRIRFQQFFQTQVFQSGFRNRVDGAVRIEPQFPAVFQPEISCFEFSFDRHLTGGFFRRAAKPPLPSLT